ncbi:MAG TPA: wax ester/triacylglycerol synthase family O-acyltransferase [Burkholderiaceae bacterium]|nr:wax ester/triacylglycerol synthase family O-acyltransferase [Burkholderiaceae bacterium]
MKPLSGLDSLFLHLETPSTPMHVGAVHLLERPRRSGDFLERVRRHVARRLHLSPVFTRQLASMPLEFANPVWVRADHVDLTRHVVRVTLPAPGSLAQLEAAIARLHAQPLDRSRPLWRFHVIEGLADGGLAFYTKVHHATLDGAAGVALALALLDLSPSPRTVERPRRRSPDRPGLVALVGTALRVNSSQTVHLVRQLPSIARIAAQLLRSSTGFSRNLAFGPRAPFNRAIDAGRSFATASLPLADVKRIAEAHGATLNDVVLTLVSGALRAYMKPHGGIPKKSMVAAMPVSLREAGNTEATTMATMTLASLATNVADPIARLRAVQESTRSAKDVTRQLKGVIPTDFPSLGLPWLLSAAAGLYGRTALADRIPPIANLVVSNVPGPHVPLYLAGARLKTYWPVSIVEHGLGLNITLQSYAGSLDFGVLAARVGVPDARPLARGLHQALDELAQATRESAPPEAVVRGATAPRRRAPASKRASGSN